MTGIAVGLQGMLLPSQIPATKREPHPAKSNVPASFSSPNFRFSVRRFFWCIPRTNPLASLGQLLLGPNKHRFYPYLLSVITS